jgi:hypothetical protein
MATKDEKDNKTPPPKDDKETKWVFKTALDYLLTAASAVKDAHMKKENANSQIPFWSACVDTMTSVFIGYENPKYLTKMFMKLYVDYRNNLIKPIFDEDGSPNDDWLMTTELLPGPGIKIPKKSASKKIKKNDFLKWSSKVYCKGVVIYSDEDEPTNYQASIPISEIYITSRENYAKEYAEKKTISVLPAKVLYGLYSCVHRSILEGNISEQARSAAAQDLSKIEKNIKELKAYIEKNSPKKEAQTSTGNMVDNLIEKFSKFTGINVDREKISSTILSITQNKDVKQIGDTVKKLVTAVDASAQKDGDDKSKVQSVISAVAGSLQTKEVSEMVADTALSTQKLLSSIPNNKNITDTLTSAGIDPSGLKPLLDQFTSSTSADKTSGEQNSSSTSTTSLPSISALAASSTTSSGSTSSDVKGSASPSVTSPADQE